MTPDKQQQKLAGQTTIAQKVFQFTPVEEPWTPLQVASALSRATGSRIDMHILKGCLAALTDSGLARMTGNGLYQRVPVSRPSTTTPKEQPTMITTEPSAPVSAIDLLDGIAKRMRALATDIEAAALSIEEERAKDAVVIQKAQQLQALLKGFA